MENDCLKDCFNEEINLPACEEDTITISRDNLGPEVAIAYSRGEYSYFGGVIPMIEVSKLNSIGNVRDALFSSNGKRPPPGHKNIMRTMKYDPGLVVALNGGIHIVARSYKVVGNKIKLIGATIIDGTQTQSCHNYLLIRDAGQAYLSKLRTVVSITITEDEVLRNEKAIAVNSRIKVDDVSIMFRRGELNELYERFKGDCGREITMKQSDFGGSKVPVKMVLKAAFAVAPEDVIGDMSLMTPYTSNKACLRRFSAIYAGAKNGNAKDLRAYNFILDIAAQAYALYEKWSSSGKFNKHNIGPFNKKTKLHVVDDGNVFPVVSAYRNFVRENNGKFKIVVRKFDEDKVVSYIARANKRLKSSNKVGKEENVYKGVSRFFK